ncbi:metal-dependent transcriptional regulator [Streptococcus macacae]|uniref:Manganese transport regulator n=1 Tax=Streptococcus macacae NCTC 11558 TaxID=764298 RepID=G5JV63_9STRE|nr:metal-dependent transcriptional regulator [Streptococcus macacae]EHJ52008.1 iron dependent repressor, metal binding/dimerization domain protein [Streptococcus macacae NCTC 11558]SUN77688.1 metal-dependent transcriptional regulator [Streptococcus macacae NCTC 11558]
MTPNKEDYLKIIYELGEYGEKISNKQIAEKMSVSAPAVSEMVKKLLSEGLILKDKQTGYLLTKKGQILASFLYRKHRLIEVFLMNHLNYTADEIHEEAEVLEHTVSNIFIERLDKLLHYPKVCPHGGTIPQYGELLVEKYHTTLKDTKEEGTYVLKRVQDNFQLLKYMEQHHLSIGDELTLLEYNDFADAYTIEKEGKQLQITSAVASQIYVEKKKS